MKTGFNGLYITWSRQPHHYKSVLIVPTGPTDHVAKSESIPSQKDLYSPWPDLDHIPCPWGQLMVTIVILIGILWTQSREMIPQKMRCAMFEKEHWAGKSALCLVCWIPSVSSPGSLSSTLVSNLCMQLWLMQFILRHWLDMFHNIVTKSSYTAFLNTSIKYSLLQKLLINILHIALNSSTSALCDV